MKYRSDKIADSNCTETAGKIKLNNRCCAQYARGAFSLVETVAALTILALFSSTVLVVIDRCMTSAADSAIRMQAFEVARENMETLLSEDMVSETTEYGSSNKYPQIQWQKTVETFYEPITSRIWVRAVCSAGYTDTAGEKQTVELTHWLTDLTKQQLLQIMEQQQKGSEQDNIIKTAEEAAEYAGVDERTIEQWQADGMLKTNDGYYIKSWLDLYLNSGGKPSVEQKNLQRQIDAKLIESTQEQNQPTEQSEKSGQNEQGEQDGKSEQGGKSESDEKLIYGYTIEQLEQMSFDEVWEIALKNR